MSIRTAGFASIACVVSPIPAVAHHSFALVDASHLTTRGATVTEFQWSNPHDWIIVTVADSEGQPVQWAIEMNGPSGLVRDGWYSKTLTPGMNVKVVIHPLRDGKKGGQYLGITLPDGTQMGSQVGRAGGAQGADGH